MGLKAAMKKTGKEVAAGVTVAITLELIRTLGDGIRKVGRAVRRRLRARRTS